MSSSQGKNKPKCSSQPPSPAHAVLCPVRDRSMAGLSTPVRAGAAAFASPRDTTPTPSRARHVKAVLLAMGQERRLLASYVHWDREEPMSYRDKLQGILNSSGG